MKPAPAATASTMSRRTPEKRANRVGGYAYPAPLSPVSVTKLGRARPSPVNTIPFTSRPVVPAAACAAPLLADLLPGIALPSVVVEIVLGIVIGPSVLGWADADEPVRVLALLGLSFLLLIAGLEVDFERLRGRLLAVTAFAFGIS